MSVDGGDPESRPYRLFAAIWPDPQVRQQLHRHARAWQDLQRGRLRAVPARRLHLTLVFIGAVQGRDALQRCLAACAAVVSPDFSLRLDRAGHFGRGARQHVWLGPTDPPAALGALQARLYGALSQAGCELESSLAFVPHVTLLRGQSPAEPPPVSIDWTVRDFALVHSHQDSNGLHYDVLRRFPLQSGSGG